MTDEARERWNAYMRKYYKNNKDKMREYRKKYYEKNKEKMIRKNNKFRKKDSVLSLCIKLEGESKKKFLKLLEIKRIPKSQFMREVIEKYIKENENILTDRTLNIIEILKGDTK